MMPSKSARVSTAAPRANQPKMRSAITPENRVVRGGGEPLDAPTAASSGGASWTGMVLDTSDCLVKTGEPVAYPGGRATVSAYFRAMDLPEVSLISPHDFMITAFTFSGMAT